MSWWNPLAWGGLEPRDSIWGGVGNLLGPAAAPNRTGDLGGESWHALAARERGGPELIRGIGDMARTGAGDWMLPSEDGALGDLGEIAGIGAA
jgi:hypothetical protein